MRRVNPFGIRFWSIAVLLSALWGPLALAQPGRSMSLNEYVSNGELLVVEMGSALEEVTRLYEQSSADADDAQRTEFLLEAQRQIEGFIAVSNQALTTLRSTTSGSKATHKQPAVIDPSASSQMQNAAAQFNLIYRSSVRVRQLLQQARGYSGASNRFSGRTSRNPFIDPRIPRSATWLSNFMDFFLDPVIGTTLGPGTEGVTP